MNRKGDGWIGRETDRRQRCRETDRETDRGMERDKHRYTDKLISRQTGGRMDRQRDRQS